MKNVSDLAQEIRGVLSKQDVSNLESINLLAKEVIKAKNGYQCWLRQLEFREGYSTKDILTWIHQARTNGDLEETIWRCFLAIHYGRPSANGRKIESAGLFLCGFTDQPIGRGNVFPAIWSHSRIG